jgi:hypothetical protein
MFSRNVPFVGFHTILAKHENVEHLLRLVSDGLAPMGFNTLILEARYAYRCFPEYAQGTVSAEDLRLFRDTCAGHGIRLVPLHPCLSHQSAGRRGQPVPFLQAHREFLECPDVPEDAEWPDFALHSWCAANDGVFDYVLPMLDDMADACGAEAVHIGLDELFEIGRCPACRGKNIPGLFADTVKRLHDHLAGKGRATMMWGDRLLDAQTLGYSMWEGDREGIYPALQLADKITRDIIITDWHYDWHSHGYPSVETFMKEGFFVVPSFWNNADNAKHFWLHCLEDIYLGNKLNWPGRMGGLLCTHWQDMDGEIAGNMLRVIKGCLAGDIPVPDSARKGDGAAQVMAAVVPRGKLFRK